MKVQPNEKLEAVKEKIAKSKDCKTKEAILADIEVKQAAKTVTK